MNASDLGALLFAKPLMALTIASILVAVLAGMLTNHPRLGHALRNAAYLGLVAALLLTVAQLAAHNGRSDAAILLDRTAPASARGGETVIPMARDGHFWLEAQLNGHPVVFLIDTGATYTSVSGRVASSAGLVPDEDDKGVILNSANGSIVARMATAGSLTFGNIRATGLPMAILPNTDVDTNVIGMNLLSQMASWRVEGKYLILKPRQA